MRPQGSFTRASGTKPGNITASRFAPRSSYLFPCPAACTYTHTNTLRILRVCSEKRERERERETIISRYCPSCTTGEALVFFPSLSLPEGLRSQWLCRRPRAVQAEGKDRKVYREPTPVVFHEIFFSMQRRSINERRARERCARW